MPLPAPKPVDALRQHTRAVVLISADGDATPSLLDAIRDSEIPCELIGHPLVAMAELVRLERDDLAHAERTALFVADDERIEQLSPLFAAVRTRLPQVGIWVIAGDFAVQVQRPVLIETMPPQRAAVGVAPQLRIVEHHEEPDAHHPVAADAHAAARADSALPERSDAPGEDLPHSTALTAEELDMLLGWDDRDAGPPDPRGGRR